MKNYFFAGKPTVQLVQSSGDPENGGNVVFACTGTSTTVPRDHGLGMRYSWSFDNINNPTGTRFTYHGNSLTVSRVTSSDQYKVVSCTATEMVDQGLTSDPSSQLPINVMCKFK